MTPRPYLWTYFATWLSLLQYFILLLIPFVTWAIYRKSISDESIRRQLTWRSQTHLAVHHLLDDVLQDVHNALWAVVDSLLLANHGAHNSSDHFHVIDRVLNLKNSNRRKPAAHHSLQQRANYLALVWISVYFFAAHSHAWAAHLHREATAFAVKKHASWCWVVCNIMASGLYSNIFRKIR